MYLTIRGSLRVVVFSLRQGGHDSEATRISIGLSVCTETSCAARRPFAQWICSDFGSSAKERKPSAATATQPTTQHLTMNARMGIGLSQARDVKWRTATGNGQPPGGTCPLPRRNGGRIVL